MDSLEERTLAAIHQEAARRFGVAICPDCGGKYRPAGGPCIHEHPRGVMRELGPVCCLLCGGTWRPGHACATQAATAATTQEERSE